MSEMYSFLFCLGLGIFARVLFIGTNALAKRTNILPVTFVLDALTVVAVGAGFTLFVIFSGAVLAPYMFAALCSGYLFTYWLTKYKPKPEKAKREKRKRDRGKRSAPVGRETNA
ncbi:hypothetical protein [Anaerocaecibacter muris]|uniref:hypothetical protein n=1 Tax=Anaerocaecibacter muris TaxID=2941513 RepID=UPI003F68D2CB